MRPTVLYVEHLYRETQQPEVPEKAHVAKMKKYLNFVGQGVDPRGDFLHAMRRTATEAELFAVCDRHLLAHAGEPFALEPYPGVVDDASLQRQSLYWRQIVARCPS